MLTDKDIIKALECCIEMQCTKCPMNYDDCEERDFDSLVKRAIQVFNRQQAENERLKGYNENLQTANTYLLNEILEINADRLNCVEEVIKNRKIYEQFRNTDKSDAIREYMKKLEEKLSQNIDISNNGYQSIIFDMEQCYKKLVVTSDA